ncbi:MAG: CBS domain-containing protein [Burkholderiales bacterium]|nr:CBS domain-containing protein [Burkholderiales bacterium]
MNNRTGGERADLLERLREAIASGADARAAAELNELHASEIADLLESCPPEERAALWRLADPQVKGDILIETHGEVRRQLIDESTPDELVAPVQRLDLDALSDIYDELPPGVVEAVLAAMDAQRRERFTLVRTYPPDTAGGLMDVDALAARPDVTLRMVLSYLARYRAEHGRLPAHTDAVMVTDLAGDYLGRLAVTDLVSLDLERRVHEVMDRDTEAIAADTPAARVARRFEDEDLVSAAVVDGRGRLIGRITVDDVMDVIREQAENAVLAGAGLTRRPTPSRRRSPAPGAAQPGSAFTWPACSRPRG